RAGALPRPPTTTINQKKAVLKISFTRNPPLPASITTSVLAVTHVMGNQSCGPTALIPCPPTATARGCPRQLSGCCHFPCDAVWRPERHFVDRAPDPVWRWQYAWRQASGQRSGGRSAARK